jgi:hypothetical protein
VYSSTEGRYDKPRPESAISPKQGLRIRPLFSPTPALIFATVSHSNILKRDLQHRSPLNFFIARRHDDGASEKRDDRAPKPRPEEPWNPYALSNFAARTAIKIRLDMARKHAETAAAAAAIIAANEAAEVEEQKLETELKEQIRDAQNRDQKEKVLMQLRRLIRKTEDKEMRQILESARQQEEEEMRVVKEMVERGQEKEMHRIAWTVRYQQAEQMRRILGTEQKREGETNLALKRSPAEL